jgi:hypothetical protein
LDPDLPSSAVNDITKISNLRSTMNPFPPKKVFRLNDWLGRWESVGQRLLEDCMDEVITQLKTGGTAA